MSVKDLITAVRELESYGVLAETDEALEDAIRELGLADED